VREAVAAVRADRFVAARNSSGRPTLMHRVGPDLAVTACGYSMAGWSRVYFAEALEILLCLRCKRIVAQEVVVVPMHRVRS
jgi:hypothetical protein